MHHGPRWRHCRPAGARGFGAKTHQIVRGEVRERAEALASSPGRKKGTGMAQFRRDAAQRFTAASAVVLNARSSGNGGEETGGMGRGRRRATLPTSYPSARERREDRGGSGAPCGLN